MIKFDQDELYLLVDFLEEQLDNQRHKECWGLDLEQQEELAVEEFMFERTRDIIKSLIKE
ncbi:hypothetical protein D3C71_1969690 [compost metagenome]